MKAENLGNIGVFAKKSNFWGEMTFKSAELTFKRQRYILFIISFLKILGGEVEKSELTFKTKLAGEKLGEKRGWYNGVVR